ncbi:hypothetical protein Pcinc_024149, partial [Petrolisthes cinctipes]
RQHKRQDDERAQDIPYREQRGGAQGDDKDDGALLPLLHQSRTPRYVPAPPNPNPRSGTPFSPTLPT